MCNASPTSVAVDGRSANRLVTAKIKLRSTFTPTSCTSTCRNLAGEKKGMMEWEKGKRERGRRKEKKKRRKVDARKTYRKHMHEQSINHIALKKRQALMLCKVTKCAATNTSLINCMG